MNEVFKALSEPNRRKILHLLKKGEMAAGDIAGKLKITGATVSHHLDTLRQADLISAERRGQQIFYSLNLSVLDEIMEKIFNFFKK